MYDVIAHICECKEGVSSLQAALEGGMSSVFVISLLNACRMLLFDTNPIRTRKEEVNSDVTER